MRPLLRALLRQGTAARVAVTLTAARAATATGYVEYWNLVFTGYNMDENQQLSPLPAQNIDTGMGLERVAALKQDVDSVFLTDALKPLVELGEEIAGKTLRGRP